MFSGDGLVTWDSFIEALVEFEAIEASDIVGNFE
jgi:hypothetical protein